MDELPMEKIRVKALLNYTSAFLVYDPGDQLFCAAVFTMLHASMLTPELSQGILRAVWRELNCDDPAEPWAIKYRENRYRSLSTGDVVVIGEQAWTAHATGWQPCSVRSDQVWYDLGALAKPTIPDNFADRFKRTYGAIDAL